MDPTTDLLLAAAKALHISPVAAALWIPLIIIVSNRIAKVIPDNATGPLKWLRLMMVVLGIKVANNTGVTPVMDSTGKLIQREEPQLEPDVAAGVVEIAPVVPVLPPVKEMFKQGAAAIDSKDVTDAG